MLTLTLLFEKNNVPPVSLEVVLINVHYYKFTFLLKSDIYMVPPY
jgi:hypothetical protein